MRKTQAPSPFALRPSPISGVTLTEVLIVVVILAILAAVALPQYSKTIEVNYRQQAQDLLTTIYYGERAYRLANDKFIEPGGTWETIFMDNPAVGDPAPITYAVTAADDSFTATATRAGGPLCVGRRLRSTRTARF